MSSKLYLSEAKIVDHFVSLRDNPHGPSMNAQIIVWVEEMCDKHGYVLTDDAHHALARYRQGYEQEQQRERTLQAAE